VRQIEIGALKKLNTRLEDDKPSRFFAAEAPEEMRGGVGEDVRDPSESRSVRQAKRSRGRSTRRAG
jgi:hypothetical protein